HPPEQVKPFLEKDMFRLYELIWNRFIACQMVPAVFDQTIADIKAGRATFRATGQILKFPGYLAVYGQEAEQPEEAAGAEKKEGRFFPTDLGKIVTELLLSAFPRVMDVQFTARMEEELDEVEEGKIDWQSVLGEFYEPFKKSLAAAEAQMRDVKREEKPTDLVCEKCGSPMVIKWGRMGRCLACSGYPDCKNTKDFIEEDGKIKVVEDLPTDETCPTCGQPMVNKRGRFGRVLACSHYPACTP